MARATFTEPPRVTLRLNGDEARFLKALLGNMTRTEIELILETHHRRDLRDEFKDLDQVYYPSSTIWKALTELDIAEKQD